MKGEMPKQQQQSNFHSNFTLHYFFVRTLRLQDEDLKVMFRGSAHFESTLKQHRDNSTRRAVR